MITMFTTSIRVISYGVIEDVLLYAVYRGTFIQYFYAELNAKSGISGKFGRNISWIMDGD